MTIEVSTGGYEELQEFLKTSTLVIAILRNIFHLLTTTGVTYSYLTAKYPCTFGGACGGGEDWSGVIFAIVLIYFLADIVSLPQDIYYIWATTTSDLDLSSTLAQLLGFGLAGTNVIGVAALITGLFLFNFNERYTSPYLTDTPAEAINSLISMTLQQTLFFFPQIVTMLGSIGYAVYIALNQAII